VRVNDGLERVLWDVVSAAASAKGLGECAPDNIGLVRSLHERASGRIQGFLRDPLVAPYSDGADRSPIRPIGGDFRSPRSAALQVLEDVRATVAHHLERELYGVALEEIPDDEQQATEAVHLAISVQRKLAGLVQAVEDASRQTPFHGSEHRLAGGPGQSSQPRCIRREDVRLQAYSAPVVDGVHRKYLGDRKYVEEIVGPVDERDCLAVGARYKVQILAIRRKNSLFEWFPGIATCFQIGDMVYYAAVHQGPELAQFEEQVVQGSRKQPEEFETVELMGYENGRPVGAPRHLWHCVIGAAEHRRGQLSKGALYFRKTFGNIAIHLIVRRSGQRIPFPGPFDDFQEGDHIFTVCKIASKSGRQTNHLLLDEPESVEVLLSPEKFYDHVREVNARGHPGISVILPRGEQPSAGSAAL